MFVTLDLMCMSTDFRVRLRSLATIFGVPGES